MMLGSTVAPAGFVEQPMANDAMTTEIVNR
jgi:hypothetical protein